MWSGGAALRELGQALILCCQKLGRLVKGATLAEFLRIFAFGLTRVAFGIASSCIQEQRRRADFTPTGDYLNILEGHSIHESKVISKSSDSTTWNWGPRSSASSWKHLAFIWGKKDGIDWSLSSIDYYEPGDESQSGSDWKVYSAREAHDQRIPN